MNLTQKLDKLTWYDLINKLKDIFKSLKFSQPPSGLEGTQYIFVEAKGTDVENATELQAAYDKAKTMSPSATNRITIIAAPANYNFGTSIFEMDTQYIDLVSLDGNRSIVFNGEGEDFYGDYRFTILVSANDVFVKGVDTLQSAFKIENNLNLLKVENCKVGTDSFGSFGGIVSGTFTNCTGGSKSFGGSGTLSGKLYYCRLTFGTFQTVSGGGRTYYCVDGNGDTNNQ